MSRHDSVGPSPEGKEAASAPGRRDSRSSDESPFGGRPERPGGQERSSSAWQRSFDAENARRRREDREVTLLLNATDKEPGRTKDQGEHELVWLTREVGVCPHCQHAYRRVKLATKEGTKTGIQPAYDMDSYLKGAGIFTRSLAVLEQRQEERAKEEAEREKKKGRGDLRGIVR